MTSRTWSSSTAYGADWLRYSHRRQAVPGSVDFVEYVLKQFDTNGDGVLTKEEIERLPAAQMIFGNNLAGNNMAGDFTAPTLFQLDSDSDGKITVDELATYFRRNGGPPIQVQSLSSPRPASPRVASAGQRRPATAEAFDEVLFGLLDADKDGKLSREELTAARTSCNATRTATMRS